MRSLRPIPLALALSLAAPSLPWAAPWRDPAGVTWRVASTTHCRVHWHDGAEGTARRVIDLCDDVHQRVTGVLKHSPGGPVHVVVRDLEVKANGLALYDRRWVAVWATPLYFRLRGRMDWLRTVLTHEMSHVVSLDLGDPQAATVVVSALGADGRRNADAGGRVAVGGGLAPFWWTEGGAEYWTELAEENRWSTSRDMLLRAAVLESNLLDWHEWSTREGRHALGGELGYNQGYSFGRYLRERLDRGVYARLGRSFREAPGAVWERTVERVTGVPGPRLFEDWLGRAGAAYADQVDEMGPEVAGTFLALDPDDLPASPPDPGLPTVRARWWGDASGDRRLGTGRWDRWERRRRLARPGTVWVDHLRRSPDGRWLGHTSKGGAVVMPISDEVLPTTSGEWLGQAAWDAIDDESVRAPGGGGFDFSPDSRRIVISADGCLSEELGCLSPGGVDVPDLWIVDLETGASEQLTSGLRAVHPAWSPDGRAIAFVRRVDGEAHLGLLHMDRPEHGISWIVRRWDGTQIERPRWSPDGLRLVFAAWREGQQDIWTVGRGGGDLHPVTWDAAEDRDPVFDARGRAIYFSSDRTGVFNIHRVALGSGQVDRLTNVHAGAFCPLPLAGGDLMYLYFTSFGFKPYVLPEPASLERTVVAPPGALAVARSTVHTAAPPERPSEDPGWLPSLVDPRRFTPAWVLPALVIEGSEVSGGAYFDLQDAPGVVRLSGAALVGQEQYLQARLDLLTVPAPFIVGRLVRFSSDFGLGLDPDLDPTTPNPERALGVKARGRWIDTRAGAGLPLGDRVRLEAWLGARSSGVRLGGDGAQLQPYYDRLSGSWSAHLSTLGVDDREGDVDPRGRSIYIEHGFHGTDLPGARWDEVEAIGRPDAAGGTVDYTYHQVIGGWTEAMRVPWPDSHRHTIELHVRGGWISRNVSPGEELYAGGLHPLRLFRPEFSTTELSGYEDFAIHGETLAIAGLAYRFPLAREVHRHWGPLYLSSIWLQVFGTVGNAWGFTADFARRPAPDGSVVLHPRANGVAPALRGRPKVRPGSIRREVPLADESLSNGNLLLADVGVEVRFDLRLFELPWDSLIRVAYGFQTLRGIGDVNDDGVHADHFPNDPFVDEVEDPSLRFVLGLGTGFD